MVEPRYPERAPLPSVLAPYKKRLATWLKADNHRNKRERRGIKAMFRALLAMGYPGSRGPVCEFAKRWRQAQSDGPTRMAFMPMSFEMGEAFQFDWSCEYLFVGGLRKRLEEGKIPEKTLKGHMLGLVEPIEIARGALYLASDDSKQVTGQILRIDSGASVN